MFVIHYESVQTSMEFHENIFMSELSNDFLFQHARFFYFRYDWIAGITSWTSQRNNPFIREHSSDNIGIQRCERTDRKCPWCRCYLAWVAFGKYWLFTRIVVFCTALQSGVVDWHRFLKLKLIQFLIPIEQKVIFTQIEVYIDIPNCVDWFWWGQK